MIGEICCWLLHRYRIALKWLLVKLVYNHTYVLAQRGSRNNDNARPSINKACLNRKRTTVAVVNVFFVGHSRERFNEKKRLRDIFVINREALSLILWIVIHQIKENLRTDFERELSFVLCINLFTVDLRLFLTDTLCLQTFVSWFKQHIEFRASLIISKINILLPFHYCLAWNQNLGIIMFAPRQNSSDQKVG